MRYKRTVDLAPGEIVRLARVDGAAGSAITAILPEAHLAFSIAADDIAATEGDHVRLYDLATGRVVAPVATVLVRDDTHLTVAVPEADTASLIAALGAGGVVAAITNAAAPRGS